MDHIEIRRLEVFAYHGVYHEENELGQKFYVSASLFPASGVFPEKDLLSESVNYDDVCRNITKWMTGETFRLIETCASCLAEKILLQYPGIGKVKIDVEKPNAPVAFSIETVLAHAERAWHRVFLGIGSNLGERKEYLEEACSLLAQSEGIRVIRTSSIYETEPYGYTEQPPFLNGCVEIETWLSPDALLEQLHIIEAALGRKREEHWGPRTIDLDILLYDHEVIDTEDLHIPHIDMANRLFVLVPLSEIAGYYRHPILGITVDEMLKNLQKS